MRNYFIWGMGLLGTSIALDLKKKGHQISGCDQSSQNLEVLQKLGFDKVCLNTDKSLMKDTLSECDGIIIATPIDALFGILEEIEKMKLKPDIWITDMASTKSSLIHWLDENEPNLPFVGSHPMAGSDLNGPQNARPNLFKSATIYMVGSQKLKERLGEKYYKRITRDIKNMWEEVGAHTYSISHTEHDRWAAYLSHGPHLVSCAASILLQDIAKVFDVPSKPAGGSFRDITRVAGSNPELWEGIIRSNSEEVKAYLSRLAHVLEEWVQDFDRQEISVRDIFIRAQQAREKII